ncbi:YMGG-like glycine zipper-containing protein [Phenylobacterium deserti]|uniref:YMGG-like Gly-zipper domain-containing protein n=1 Tax=Phenylobacterium deserti TaxID=1914756 RepID=A0A328ATE0_9CAUL|nr:glycine zipper 2TM domain-containing protein [Phenylobacterium deserti]RAK56956.1 hypothetical protein DJ018_03025 [Phenylobacterium deserti]
MTKSKFARIAVAAAMTGAVALPATQAAAADRKTERAVVGALIGGVAGAAVGNGDKGAIAVGALAGAALGAATGNDRDRRYSRSYRTQRPYYANDRYYGGYDRRYDRRYDNRYAYSSGRPAYGYGYYGR